MTAKTAAERQQAFKQRQQEAGLKEIRNLWAKPEHHPKIKDYVKVIDAIIQRPSSSLE